MMIRAYDELYLESAQNILGHAVDFALMTLDIDADAFADAFLVSDASKRFAMGDPSYVAGINGCELTRLILEQTCLTFTDHEDVMYIDRSPEYWSGWALAYYQWYTGRPFDMILSAVPLSHIIMMYSPYHEMDISQFTDEMERRVKNAYPFTKLKMIRSQCGISQSALSRQSGVPLRQIQLFEQERRDINKTSAITLRKLSHALHCGMEDLMEIR